MRKIIIAAIIIACSTINAKAQQWSVATNAIDWLNFGTMNVEASVAASRHISANISARVNPWTFHKGDYDRQMQNRHQTYAAGIRYWPWYVYSGWWIGAKAQYSSSGRTGIWRPALEESRSVGGGLSFGYTVMLHEHINLEFGAGLWGGRHLDYTLYECPKCMMVRDSGGRYFIAPDDVSISLMFVF